MYEIRRASFHLLNVWWEKAINTPEIARFLSGSSYIQNITEEDLGWNKSYYLSNDRQTLVKLSLYRDDVLSIDVSLWSLHQHKFARALACGKALHFVMDKCHELNAREVTFCTASSNTDCLKLLNHKFK